jgi:hypothetical protein
MFQYLIPLMPLFGTLPFAIAAVWIARLILKSREGGKELRAELEAMREELGALRQSQSELQERIDFTERMLSQVRDARQGLPPNRT